MRYNNPRFIFTPVLCLCYHYHNVYAFCMGTHCNRLPFKALGFGLKPKYSRVSTSETALKPALMTSVGLRMENHDSAEESPLLIPTITSHVFNYINIPYQMGIRHIHALEHISDIHLLSLPFFRLKNTSFPFRVGAYTLISCDCEVLGIPKQIKMFTNKPNECQIMCFFKERTPQVHIHLTVTPLLHNQNKNSQYLNGHTLTMVCTYYKSPRWIYMQLKPLFNFLHFMEDTIFWSYDFREQDPNLAKYRRKVLYTYKE